MGHPLTHTVDEDVTVSAHTGGRVASIRPGFSKLQDWTVEGRKEGLNSIIEKGLCDLVVTDKRRRQETGSDIEHRRGEKVSLR